MAAENPLMTCIPTTKKRDKNCAYSICSMKYKMTKFGKLVYFMWKVRHPYGIENNCACNFFLTNHK